MVDGWTYAGISSGAPVEVETGHAAMRASVRPNDVGSLGQYALSGQSGTYNNLGASTLLWSMRTGAIAASVKRLALQVAAIPTPPNVVLITTYQLFIARNFTVADTGGSVMQGPGKARSSHGGSQLADMRILSTALVAGTRTLDATSIATILSPTPANVALPVPVAKSWPLLDRRAGEWPIILGPNEGLVLVGANGGGTSAGALVAQIDVEWEELAPFGPGLAQ